MPLDSDLGSSAQDLGVDSDSAPPLEVLKHPLLSDEAARDLQEIDDLYLPDEEPQEGSVFPGPAPVPESLRAFVFALVSHSRAEGERMRSRDYRINLDNLTFRVHQQMTAGGLMHVMRRIRNKLTSLQELGIPAAIREVILSNELLGGGLVLLSGRNGHGKTTTCCAAILARLQVHGGICMTFEDPIEKMMQGNYRSKNGGFGQCIQCPVEDGDFATAIRDAMRLFPSQQKSSMLLVGEVRDEDTAVQLVRAAVNGQLVFTTIHALSLQSAIERLITMSEKVRDRERIIGSSLRLAIHQRIEGGRLQAEVLFSKNGESRSAAGIRSGQIQSIQNEIDMQRRLMENGKSLLRNAQ